MKSTSGSCGESWRETDGIRKIQTVTAFLFVTTQIAALGWVSASYLIAVYATVRLGQPYPVAELSQQAITSLLGISAMKVIENIFEHNDGGLFGTSKKEDKP
ncbi:MAG: hypothetical protein HFF09_03660 [Oscillospiraceae bacterium]|nr:hypothetical protein [Oscillospiraceae bacterium]